MRHRLVVGCAVLILGALPALATSKSAPASKRISPDGGQFRLVRMTNSDGSVTLELTNLDSEGRRLGGELTHADRIRLWGAPKPAPEPEVVEVPQVPVVVNIYQMGPGGTGGESIVSGTYPGFFPGFFPIPGMGGNDPDHNRRDGNLPPTTYFSSADPHRRAIEVKPYTKGTARQRNKKFFRRN